MKNIQDIYTVASEIEKISSNTSFVNEIQKLNRQQTNAAGQLIGTNLSNVNFDIIKNILLSVDTSLWTNEHWDVAKTLGISKLLGPEGTRYIEEIKNQILINPGNRGIITPLINELSILRTKPKQIITLLNDFEITPNIEKISQDEGLIEITFQGNALIEDFKEAKEQMNDWFLIIEGYARLLDVPRQEFEIINISKNSPTKFKLKTSLKNVSLVLGVITSLLLIQRSYLDNQLLLEKLRQASLSPDADNQKQFIDNAEQHIQKEIDSKIEALVDKKIAEYNVKKNSGDIKNSLAKGIHNQYNFINNGGNINVYISNGELKPQLELLQNTKEEIKNIRTAYEYQKTISSGDTEGQEKLELE